MIGKTHVLLSAADRERHVPMRKELRHWVLRLMPAGVVYLSAAAAVEDSGICAGREEARIRVTMFQQ